MCNSIELGEHKYGVEELEDGTKVILGFHLNGEQLPPYSLIPPGYILRITAGASLHSSADKDSR